MWVTTQKQFVWCHGCLVPDGVKPGTHHPHVTRGGPRAYRHVTLFHVSWITISRVLSQEVVTECRSSNSSSDYEEKLGKCSCNSSSWHSWVSGEECGFMTSIWNGRRRVNFIIWLRKLKNIQIAMRRTLEWQRKNLTFRHRASSI